MRVLAISFMLAFHSIAPAVGAQGPRLELSTSVPVTGDEVVIRAIDGSGRSAAQQEIELRLPSEERVAAMTTSADGTTSFAAPAPGPHVLSWRTADGVDVLVPLHVHDRRSGIAYWTLPVGLFLGVSAWRRRRGRRDTPVLAP